MDTTTTSSNNVDADRVACGKFVATILGNEKSWRWEKSSSPGYVACHGMLWGGHGVSLISRFVRGTDDSAMLEMRLTCTDTTRVPMLRHCLLRRINIGVQYFQELLMMKDGSGEGGGGGGEEEEEMGECKGYVQC